MKAAYFTSMIVAAAGIASAQPYHTDTTVGGVQTLEVDGDLSVKQYGAGYGGSLTVMGESHLAVGGESIPNLPSGVVGTYYGPGNFGGNTTTSEFHFSKTGDDGGGDFIVPLGIFYAGDNGGSLIDLDITTGPADSDSGAAHFKLMCKRHREYGKLTAVEHSAFGGGEHVGLYGWNLHGCVLLFVAFDAQSNYAGDTQEHSMIIRATSFGSCDPFNRDEPFSAMFPVDIANSFSTPLAYPWGVGPTKQEITADDIVLNGNVAFGDPGTSSNISIDGAAGRINLCGTGSGVYYGSEPVFSMATAGKVVFGNSPVVISDTSGSTSSSTGAFTVAGGVGVASDSYFNEVRVGKGSGNLDRNTVLGKNAFGDNTSGARSVAIGSYALAMNTSGSWNVAVGDQALGVNTVGYANLAIGVDALGHNTGGNGNMALGWGSLYVNTTGSDNAAIGGGALQANTAGNDNSALGANALFSNTTGYGNVALGVDAGSLQAGGQPLVDAERSIYIGAGSRGYSNDDENSIVIGYGAVGAGANTAVIGNGDTILTRLFGELQVPGSVTVEGQTRLKGQVLIEEPQGDISMGIYE